MVKKSIWTFLFVLAFVGAALLFTSRTVTAARYIPVLAYHFIDTVENLPADEHADYYGYYVTPEQFENHLDIMQAYGYTTITLADLAAYMDGQPVTLPTKPVVITFDDGHQGVYQYAYPALKERGMTATFYIITDYVMDLDADRCNDADAEVDPNPNWDEKSSCQVIWDEVEAMAVDGFEIGSHSSTHPYNLNSDFTSNPSETTQLELINSKATIEAHLASYTVTTFAYPHGSGYNNAALKQALHDAGYTGAVAFGNEVEDNRVDPAVDNVFALRRLNVDTCHTNELDGKNPWCFFVMRLDPYFPYPSPDIHDVIVTDSNGDSRTTFFPGEDVYVTVQVDNWDAPPVNVKAQLSLNNANGTMYDSHPTEDQSAIPLRNDITNEFVDYHWIVPDNPAIIGTYTYAFRVMDLPFLMQYYEIISTTILFQVVGETASFDAGSNSIALFEDSGLFTATGWVQNIDPGLPTYPSQTVTFDLSSFDPGLFSQQPQINASGDLSFIPQADANGTTQITVALQVRDATNTVVRSTATQTFNITINAINDAPSFTAGVDVSVNEDSGEQIFSDWATAISAGPVDESGQVVTFSLSGYDAGLFDVPPAISASGTLSFTALENVYGSTTVSVVLGDDGGTANGGVNTSSAQILTISLNPVNDVPSFTAGSNVEVNEDSATQTLSGWATAISAGPANESSQVVHFNLSGYDAGLFSEAPAVNPGGDLTFKPAENANGSTTITITLGDDGGTANGGNDTSATQTFVITILPVNDVPSFNKGANVVVNEDSTLQTLSGWATAISAGPADESSQPLSFETETSQPELFSSLPGVSAINGNLVFTPAENANGTATVTVRLFDGDLYSAPQTFTITISAFNDAPVANGDSYGMAASQSRLLVVSAPGVLSNDQDIDGNILTVELVSTVTHGSLNLNADGSFTYTSTIGFTGTDQFTYRVWDGMAFSESAIVNITVPFIWIEIYLPMIFRF